MRFWPGAAVAACLSWSAAAGAAEIGSIRAHLVYEGTGRLSEDLVARPDFAAWNTVIGEGDAEEIANDVLVMVEVIGSGGEENIEGRLDIVARGGDGRVLGRRRIEGLLTSDRARAWKALLLPDSTCAGRVEIVATIGRSTRRAEITLACGE